MAWQFLPPVPKTDWANEGSARPNSRASQDSPNKHICVATALLGIYDAYPGKFTKARGTPFATWRNGGGGGGIPPQYATSTIRADVFKAGGAAERYSLHSMRSAGRTCISRNPRYRTGGAMRTMEDRRHISLPLGKRSCHGRHKYDDDYWGQTLRLAIRGLHPMAINRLRGPDGPVY